MRTTVQRAERRPPHRYTPLCWLPAETSEWTVEEGRDGFYVVRPFGLGCHGPYASRPLAERMLGVLRTRAGD